MIPSMDLSLNRQVDESQDWPESELKRLKPARFGMS